MRIEFWIDYLCPVTYLTHKNLIDAINELGIKGYELYYRSFQLNDQELNQLKENRSFDDLLTTHKLKLKEFSTTTIHQVAHLAKRNDVSQIFAEKVLNEIFINDHDYITDEKVSKIAKECGLDPENVKTVIETHCYSKQIDSNKINAKNRGIDKVPHIRVNMKHNLIGYQEKEAIKIFLKEILEKQPKTEVCGEYCDY